MKRPLPALLRQLTTLFAPDLEPDTPPSRPMRDRASTNQAHKALLDRLAPRSEQVEDPKIDEIWLESPVVAPSRHRLRPATVVLTENGRVVLKNAQNPEKSEQIPGLIDDTELESTDFAHNEDDHGRISHFS